MEVGTKVRNRRGKIGVVIDDLPGIMGVCGPDEVLVVYEGTTFGCGTSRSDLEAIGKAEAVASPEKCGAGKGAKCCIFLVVSGDGWECQRFGALRNNLIFREMEARRHPAEPYPGCQLS